MKVYFERSGGFAGMVTSANVDTQTLPPSEAHEIQNLIENSHFFDLPSKSPQPSKAKKGAADYFTYKITVQNDEKEHTVQFNDINMQTKIKPLIDFLVKHSQK
jgi:emfourin